MNDSDKTKSEKIITEPVEDIADGIKPAERDIPRSSREEVKRLRKHIIIVFCVAVAFLVIYLSVSAILNLIESKKQQEEQYKGNNHTIIYHEPIDNIFKDPSYYDYDRTIYYCDLSSDVRIALEKSKLSDYDEAVNLLYNYIQSIILGNAAEYSSFFSDYYYKKDGVERKDFFYMQELYNVCITRMKEPETITDNDGNTYLQYDYLVEFMIHKNNGSFMLIDSDALKADYYVISYYSGELKIDNVIPYKFAS